MAVRSGRVPGASQGACSSRKAQVLPGRACLPARIRTLLACEAVGLSAYEVSPRTGPRPAVTGSRGREAERQRLRRRQRGSGLADVSPAVSAMEPAALRVRLRSLPPGAGWWAGRRRADPVRRTNPTASRRKSSGCGGLVFGTLDLGSMDAVGRGRDRPPSAGAGPWHSWGDLA
jgi:hypothetical protein